jgi:hypothetical protein
MINEPGLSSLFQSSIIPPWGYDADNITDNTMAYLRETSAYPVMVADGAVLRDGTIYQGHETAHRGMSNYDHDRRAFHGVSEAANNFFW